MLFYFDRFMTEEQFGWRVEKTCPQALRVLDTEDLFCLRRARQQAFKDTGLINPLLSPALLFSELAQREVASILRCDLSLIVSEVELQLLTDLFKVAPSLLQYYPLCFSPEAIAQTRPPLEDRDGFYRDRKLQAPAKLGRSTLAKRSDLAGNSAVASWRPVSNLWSVYPT